MAQSPMLATTIGQFSSAGGRTQVRAANVRAVEPAPNLPGAEHGNLYMMVEVTGSGGGHAALYRQILNAMQTAFYEASGSLSAALIRAVRSAHSVLVRANEALPEAEWRAGVNLAVLQGQELTIAQAGPALALVSHPKTVDQFPAQLGTARIALGGAERPEVKLFRTTVEPGSMLLMVQSDWLNYVTPEALAVVATADGVAPAQDYLGQLAGDAELSALIVGFGPLREAVAEPPGPSTRLAEPAIAKPVPAAPEPVEHAVREVAVPAQPKPERVTAGAGVAESQPAEEAGPARRSLWPLLVALVIIPVLIGALVFAMWWLRSPRAEAQFKQALDGASAVLAQIEAQTDDAAAAQRLPAVQEFLDKARAMRPQDPRLAELEKRYQDVSDRVQHVTPLYGVVPIWEFKESGQNLTRVVAGGDSLYVLDKGRNQVYRFVRSRLGDSAQPAETPTVVQKAAQVGDYVVSDLLDMTWVEGTGSQRSRLLVLDTSGGLIAYDSVYGASRVPISGSDRWQGLQFAVGYSGNLYLADVKANQIWRYKPGEKGYENGPDAYFPAGTPVDLADLQAMAIDGSIWLLFPDGRLLKFLVGEQQSFGLKYPPGSPKTPVDLAVPLEGERLYLADAGTGRILEFSKAGELLRQFRSREGDMLKDVRSLYLDEAAGALYILTSNQLYKADVPEPAAAPATEQQ